MSRDLLAFSPRTPSVPDGPNHEGMTMTSRRPQMLLAIAALVIAPLLSPTASMQPAPRHAVEVEDVIAWKAVGSTVLSADGQWFGYRLAPQEGDAEVVVRQVRGEKAMRFAIGEAPQGAGGAGPGGAAAGAAPDRPRGTDLILRDLARGAELNVGNVSELSFRKDGKLLALAIDAQDKAGNGLQLRDMTTGAVSALDSASASYEHITWSEKGDALAVLKGNDDRAYRDKLYTVVGLTDLAAATPTKVIFDPAADSSVPKGMSVSPNRDPQWTDDLEALVFGLYEPRHKDATDDPSAEAPAQDAAPAAPDAGASPANAPANADRVDLVLWHYKDPRLQTQQEVQEARDRAFNYVAEYRVQPKKFIRLADDEMRNVTVNPRQSRWAYGSDDREYELMGSLDGRRYEDLYSIDLTTGARKPAVKHLRYFSGASPDGSHILYYENGDYHVYTLATGADRNITQGRPVSFVDVEDDHNNVKPPIGAIGWASDNTTVLLTDAWDIWLVPSDGGHAVNLTGNGKKAGIRYQRRFAL